MKWPLRSLEVALIRVYCLDLKEYTDRNTDHIKFWSYVEENTNLQTQNEAK